MHTISGVGKQLRAGEMARSHFSAWAAALARLHHLRLHMRPRRAHLSGKSLTTPNNITIVVGVPPKIALRPSNVRAAANTLRPRGRSPCGSVVRTPPRVGQVPRDVLRRRGVDRPAILYERARGFHEDFICLFLYDFTRVLLLFSGFPGPIF